jgi:hypothetical protein
VREEPAGFVGAIENRKAGAVKKKYGSRKIAKQLAIRAALLLHCPTFIDGKLRLRLLGNSALRRPPPACRAYFKFI